MLPTRVGVNRSQSAGVGPESSGPAHRKAEMGKGEYALAVDRTEFVKALKDIARFKRRVVS